MADDRKRKPGDPVYYCWWPDEDMTRDDAIEVASLYWHYPDAKYHRWAVSAYISDHEDAAEEAADYDFSNRDGWERSSDEQDIMVEDDKGVRKLFSVYREVVPQFSGTEKEMHFPNRAGEPVCGKDSTHVREDLKYVVCDGCIAIIKDIVDRWFKKDESQQGESESELPSADPALSGDAPGP